jgi:transcriptional regulator with XRE-family HTH domain
VKDGYEGFYKTLGSRIRKLRENKNLSQEELASRARISRTSVTNIECGRQAVQIHALVEFARVLGVGLDDLVPVPPATAERPHDPTEALPADARRFVQRFLREGDGGQ